MKTLKYLIITAASVAVFAMASSAFAQVDGSMHDLTTGGGATNTTADADGQFCVFCHTPHSQGTLTPLWNKGAPAGPFTMYSSATIGGTIQATPQGVSAACLSCHDGVLSLDTMYNAPTTVSGTYNNSATPVDQAWTFAPANSDALNTAVVVGTDLSNDHPISITYGADAAMEPIGNIPGAGLPLYGAGSDQVECGTCHNPHQPGLVPFLRIDNTNSALCTTCHSDK
jgi:predicted CXXCH cytochrome family protein